jgi:hypothetical protein
MICTIKFIEINQLLQYNWLPMWQMKYGENECTPQETRNYRGVVSSQYRK